MQKIAFIYFDIGQVLVSMEQGFGQFCQKMNFSLKQQHLFDSIWAAYSDDLCKGTLTPTEFTHTLKHQAKLDLPDDFDIRDMTVECFQPIGPMQSLLVQVSKHYPVGLLSNAYQNMISRLLAKHKLPQIKYAAIVDSFEEKVTKPDESIYQIATQRANLRPETILFIDDSDKNIAAAKRFGWQVFTFDEHQVDAHVSELTQLLLK